MPRKAQQPARANALRGTLKPQSSWFHPPKGGYGTRIRQLSGVLGERDCRENTAPPRSWKAPSDSPSQRNATTVAAGGSSIAAIPALVAETWRSAVTTSANGTIVPSTIIQATSVQTGACRPERWPRSGVVRVTIDPGNVHHGCTADQKSEAKRKP